MMSFGEAIKTCLFKKFFTTSGRARRSEFWWFVLFIFFILSPGICVAVIEAEKAGWFSDDWGVIIVLLFNLLFGIPLFTAFIRRLHDTGHSAWSLLWLLIPYVGWLILIIRSLSSSDPTNNGYGYDPHLGHLDPLDPRRLAYDPRSLNETMSELDYTDYDSTGSDASSSMKNYEPNDEENFDYPTDEEEEKEYDGYQDCYNCKHRNWFSGECERFKSKPYNPDTDLSCAYWEWNGKN